MCLLFSFNNGRSVCRSSLLHLESLHWEASKAPPKVTVNDFTWQEISRAGFWTFCDYLRSIGYIAYEIKSITALKLLSMIAILYMVYTVIKGSIARVKAIQNWIRLAKHNLNPEGNISQR